MTVKEFKNWLEEQEEDKTLLFTYPDDKKDWRIHSYNCEIETNSNEVIICVE